MPIAVAAPVSKSIPIARCVGVPAEHVLAGAGIGADGSTQTTPDSKSTALACSRPIRLKAACCAIASGMPSAAMDSTIASAFVVPSR